MYPIINSYKHFVLGVVKQMNPKRILEIGLGETASTAVYILSNTDKTTISIIDLSPNEKAIDLLSPYKGRYELIKADSTDAKTYNMPWEGSLTSGTDQAEIALIDGNHSSEGVYSDIKNIVLHNILSHNGMFIFHDARSSPVRDAIKRASQDFGLDIFLIPELNIGIGKFKI